MMDDDDRPIARGDVIRVARANRAAVEALARFLRLRIDAAWSAKHLASLVYWRLSRAAKRRRLHRRWD